MFSSRIGSINSNPILTSFRNWKHDYENNNAEYQRPELTNLSGILKVEIALAMDAIKWTDNSKGITDAHVAHAKKVMERFQAFESKD